MPVGTLRQRAGVDAGSGEQGEAQETADTLLEPLEGFGLCTVAPGTREPGGSWRRWEVAGGLSPVGLSSKLLCPVSSSERLTAKSEAIDRSSSSATGLGPWGEMGARSFSSWPLEDRADAGMTRRMV